MYALCNLRRPQTLTMPMQDVHTFRACTRIDVQYMSLQMHISDLNSREAHAERTQQIQHACMYGDTSMGASMHTY